MMKPKSLKAIEGELLSCSDKAKREELFKLYAADERRGVHKIIEKLKKADEKIRNEELRVEAMCSYEKEYGEYEFICGIDEAGRGPLAGPVVAAAVILPKDSRIMYINDSKKLSPKKRDELFDIICAEALSYGIGIIGHERIDEINILKATYEAMRSAIASLSIQPTLLLNDAVTIPMIDIRQIPIIKGDAICQSIAAASIIAKVTRDRLMETYNELYPQYHFDKNKGYGSAVHIEAIKRFGPSPIHRKTFIGNFI